MKRANPTWRASGEGESCGGYLAVMLPAHTGIGLPLLEHVSTEDSFKATRRIVVGTRSGWQVKFA
ncbi:hypothetical protein BN2476_930036 [Paraburkholderia piptadeniae]|uniref:Uncharacterized protein n=1 Tax=Paraburkholderia piptadeniae TaxID=1701573 RepID=A0A1N7STV2_9BURK|nr:hypothetical protein BN2476_930036 [Paraburkholderia piptadeniae]